MGGRRREQPRAEGSAQRQTGSPQTGRPAMKPARRRGRWWSIPACWTWGAMASPKPEPADPPAGSRRALVDDVETIPSTGGNRSESELRIRHQRLGVQGTHRHTSLERARATTAPSPCASAPPIAATRSTLCAPRSAPLDPGSDRDHPRPRALAAGTAEVLFRSRTISSKPWGA